MCLHAVELLLLLDNFTVASLSQYILMGLWMESTTLKFVIKLCNQIACADAEKHATYSASKVEAATIFCLILDQEIAPLLVKK